MTIRFVIPIYLVSFNHFHSARISSSLLEELPISHCVLNYIYLLTIQFVAGFSTAYEGHSTRLL